jgi:prepilin-type N-terminal cleavage/methylation domain-containing protein
MKNFLQHKSRKITGYTLIELLIVIGIIGILSTISIISFSAIRSNEVDTRVISDMKMISFGLERYRAVYGQYPQCIGTNCDNIDGSGWYTCLGTALEPYIGKIPTDPVRKLNLAYCYFVNVQANGKEVELQYHLNNYVDPKSIGAGYYYSPAAGVNLYHNIIQSSVN